jgi:ElaB/YqjD/DUF883 family membrane-anchored ribosome-binding protein
MELYYKDLISEDASLEKLVDNLTLVVQGADEFAAAASAGLETERRREISSRLQRLKDACRRIEDRTIYTAQAAGKMVRRFPYSSAGFAFGLGLLIGALVAHHNGDEDDEAESENGREMGPEK